MNEPLIAALDREPVADFVARLRRFNPYALVRLRPRTAELSGAIWATLPFQVAVCRRLRVPPTDDVTVSASDLLSDEVPQRKDAAWRWPLPTSDGQVIETIPAADVIKLAEAAARTLREASTQGVGGRAVGERVLRDALLDHVAICVTTDSGERVEVPQRLVQAIVRMGLLPAGPTGDLPDVDTGPVDMLADGDQAVTVRLAMGWIGVSGLHGCAWYRPISPLRLA